MRLNLLLLISNLIVATSYAADVKTAFPLLQAKTGDAGRLELFALPNSGAKLMGYTDKPVPEGIEMPPALREWMTQVQRAAEYADLHPEAILGVPASQSASEVISPLLGGIEWTQDSPYSDQCPKGTYVGCVATAMAQVMYYWKYPEHGYDSRTWVWQGDSLFADFGNTTYRWDLMYDKHHDYDSEESNNEVAKLSYHCGVSIDMMYSSAGSGSYTERIPYALSHYFGYNSRIASVWRTDYTYDEWNAILMEELRNARPIIFSGASDTAGHAFVIDGRNSKGLYHVNWGWDGYYDGYYDICILNPTGTGIGATPSAEGFSNAQTAIIQCTPEQGIGRMITPVHTDYVAATFNYGDSSSPYPTDAHVSNYFSNMWNDTIHGVIGLEIIDTLTQNTTWQLNDTVKMGPVYTYAARGKRSYFYWGDQKIRTAELPDGCYRIFPCYKGLDGDTAIYRVPMCLYSNHGLCMTLQDGKIVDGYEVEHNDFGLLVDAVSGIDSIASTGHTYDMKVRISNSGSDTFAGTLFFYFSSSNGVTNFMSSEVEVSLKPSEEKVVSMPLTFDQSTDWYGAIYAYSRNMCSNWKLMDLNYSSDFTSESPASLWLTSSPVLLTERPEVDGEVKFQLVLNNLGGNFSEDLQMQVYSGKTCTGDPKLIISQHADIAMQAKGDSVIVSGTLTGLKAKTKYYVLPYYINAKGESERMGLYGSGTSAISPIELKVYAASAIEEIYEDRSENTPAFDLFGRQSSGSHSTARFLIRDGHIVTNY